MTGAYGTAGIYAAHKIAEKIVPAGTNPTLQMLAPSIIGIVGALLLRKFNPKIAAGVAVGSAVYAGVRYLTQSGGLSGAGMGILPMHSYDRGIGALPMTADGQTSFGNQYASEYATG